MYLTLKLNYHIKKLLNDINLFIYSCLNIHFLYLFLFFKTIPFSNHIKNYFHLLDKNSTH